MKIALRISVESYRGTREGVPRLLDLLNRLKVGASFMFSLGPDHTGRSIAQGFSQASMYRANHQKVIAHYGTSTLLYGTVLPAPEIGRRCSKVMLDTQAAGFETAIHCWNHRRWQHQIANASASWTASEMNRAYRRYSEIFGGDCRGHGAPSWQMNIHALRLTQRLGYRWASDCRGSHPFVPVWNGELIHCPQLPTTLPTLEELIGNDGITSDNVHQHLMNLTASAQPTGHVFAIRADPHDSRNEASLGNLLSGWLDQGHEVCSLNDLRDSMDFATLPRHELTFRTVPGRAGLLLTQGEEFLSTWKDAA